MIYKPSMNSHGTLYLSISQLVHHEIMPYYIIYIWVNYNDLTATSLESWLVREIIPKWP